MSSVATENVGWTPERVRLREWFHEYAPRLEAPYEAAVRLLHDADFPARRHLLSHLVREIANGLPEAITGSKLMRFDQRKALDDLAEAWRAENAPTPAFTDSAAPPQPSVSISTPLFAQIDEVVRGHERVKQTRRDKTALLMDALRPGSLALRPALEPIIREWVEVVDWFQSHAHVPRKPVSEETDEAEVRRQFEAELQRRFRHFEDGLHGLIAGHFEVTREIDEILQSSPPSVDTLNRLMRFLGGAEQMRHFFAKIDDAGWLPALEQRGWFKHPPGAVVHESAAGTSRWYPDWPASKFLVRVAGFESAHDCVVAIALEIPDTDNPRVHRDVADIALQVKPRLAAKLAPRLVAWLPNSYVDWSQLHDKLGALAARLAKGGEHDTALGLLRALVGDPVRGHRGKPSTFEPYSLRRILGRHLDAIVSHVGIEAPTALCDALEAIVRSWAEHTDAGSEWDDRSEVWRPAVDRDGQFPGSTRDVLVGAVVRATALCGARDQTGLIRVIEDLESRRWRIFRRIALFLLASTPDAPPTLVAARLLDRKQFDSFDRMREYRVLLQRGFARLATEQRQQILTWIDAGPDRAEIRGFLERWAAREPTDDDVARACRRWQWRRLAVVQSDLPTDWSARFASLAQEFGVVEPDAALDLPVWPAREEPASEAHALEYDQLRTMPVAEIAARVRTPWAERMRQPSFVTEFQIERLARDDAQRIASDALAFEGCPPEIVAMLLWGLKAAAQERRVFNWSHVLRLGSWALGQATAHQGTQTERLHSPSELVTAAEGAWHRTLSALIDLLEAGLRAPSSSLTLHDRDSIWQLVATLARSRAPETRARAVDLVAFYRWWVEVRIAERASRQEGPSHADAPEVARTLNVLLDDTPAVEVYAALGRRIEPLAFFEHDWLQQHVDRIFPTDAPPLWQAAWNAYVDEYPRASAPSFDVLRHVYASAIETMALPGITGGELMGVVEPERAHAQVLAEHLLDLYGLGVIEATDASLRRLFERADGRLRLHALFWVGREIQRSPHEPVVARFRVLWQLRRNAVEAKPALADELPAFGSWFASGAFDDEWALDQLEFVLSNARPVEGDTDWWEPVRLTVEVLRRLADLASHTPRRVVRSLALLAGRLTTSLHLHPSPIKTILAAALRSGDATARGEAIEAFHKLGSLGFRAHELLPFSDDLDDPAAIPYFTWDHPMTVAEIRTRLVEASEPERDRLLGQILREAKDTDVWKLTTPNEVVQRWSHVERHLGKRRAFWELLLGQWKEQGLLAG